MGFIARARPALVILDLWMQDAVEAGVRIVQSLRDAPGTATIPVIVCAAAARVLARRGEELRIAGCVLLPKPFHLDELPTEIVATVSGSQ